MSSKILTQLDFITMAQIHQMTMDDKCRIFRRTSLGRDRLNAETFSYPEAGDWECTFKESTGLEVSVKGRTTVEQTLAEVEVAATILPGDRFQLIVRNGIPVTGEPVYEVYGDPDNGISAVVVLLRRVV